jgi:hypothetical protein
VPTRLISNGCPKNVAVTVLSRFVEPSDTDTTRLGAGAAGVVIEA